MHKNKPINLVDATLREGCQAPYVRFTSEQSVQIATRLAAAGIDAIECGHPIISPGELERVQAVVAARLGIPVLTHARAYLPDIRTAADAGADWVGIFVGISEICRRTRLRGRTVEEVLKLVETAIEHAKHLGLKVRYTVEDGSRTDGDLLEKVYQVAVDAGADRICFADTVGILDPRGTAKAVRRIHQKWPAMPLEVHLHDDRGLAMANVLAAIERGATWVAVSVNGLGERCGIPDMSMTIANLAHVGRRPPVDYGLLRELSAWVAAHSRAVVDARRPIVGRHAFWHQAKLHADSMAIDDMSYAWSPSAAAMADVTTVGDTKTLPVVPAKLVVGPKQIPATELPYHRRGPGERFVMLDNRFVPDCRHYCILRVVPQAASHGEGHVDAHSHAVDSIFLFLGNGPNLEGLIAQVQLGSERFEVTSPAAVFIPAGILHSYRFLSGGGIYINFVACGSYLESLLPQGVDHVRGI